MKGLVLKDLYNIRHNAKSMLFTLIILAVVFIPSAHVSGYIVFSAVLFGIMTMTTFAFDEKSDWTRYAMIMPLSKKDIVCGKYAVLAIFSAIGVLFGFAVSFITLLVTNNLTATAECLLTVPVAFTVSLVVCSTTIPLVFKFGTERARIFLAVSVLVPTAVCFAAYKLLGLVGVGFSDQAVLAMLCCSPAAALIWCFVSYKISCRIFNKQDV